MNPFEKYNSEYRISNNRLTILFRKGVFFITDSALIIAKNDILRTIKMNDASITKELLLSLVAHHSSIYSKRLITKTTMTLLNRAVSLIWKDTFGYTPEFISNCF